MTRVIYEKYNGFHGDAAARQRFEADYADEIDQIRQQLILDELRVFERAKEELDRAEGFILLCHGRRLHRDESGKMWLDADRMRIQIACGRGRDAATNPEEGLQWTAVAFSAWQAKAEYLIYENGKMTKDVSQRGVSQSRHKIQ
ncbi:MAG: hypothetical protein ACOX4J_05935 [Anaerovoracaceae bacterium]